MGGRLPLPAEPDDGVAGRASPAAEPIELPADSWEGTGAGELARRWRVPRVHLFRRVGSTNDIARALAGAGAPAGTVVLAEEQLAGRGRGGRAWESPAGLGLWLSLVHREKSAEAISLLPLIVGLAAARALEQFAAPATLQLKWPNDLLLDGAKLGGILCEGVWQEGAPALVIVGVGINVLQQPEDFPSAVRPLATSLRIGSGRASPRAEVAAALVPALVDALALGMTRIGVPLVEELEARDALRGRVVMVTDAAPEPLHGRALGIAPDGALLLRTREGSLRRVRSGSVRLAGEEALDAPLSAATAAAAQAEAG